MSTRNHSTEINALIAAANCARWLALRGPTADRAAHDAHADAILEQLRRRGVDWAKEARG